jgi:glycosyltransferase involved in cell wall biosynthesis
VRILVIASWYKSAKAPVRGSFIREQALALARRGHDVSVVFVDPDSHSRPFALERSRDDALDQISIAAPWPLHRVFGFYMPQPLVKRVRCLIAETRPDVVHAHAVRPAGVIATRAAAAVGVPVFLTEHKKELSTYWTTRHGWLQIREAYESCARLLAVSQEHKGKLERYFPSTQGRWDVAYNGVDTERFHIDPDRVRPGRGELRKILFLGGLEEAKGLATLMEALRQLPPSFILTVAGPGAVESRVVALAGRSDIVSRIRTVGLVDRERVVALLNSHDVLAVPSYIESFGLVCAEALACGIPVVATRCGGPEEIVREPFGEIVEPRDSKALARALERVCAALDRWVPESARAYIEQHFSLAGVAARLEREYQAMLH